MAVEHKRQPLGVALPPTGDVGDQDAHPWPNTCSIASNACAVLRTSCTATTSKRRTTSAMHNRSLGSRMGASPDTDRHRPGDRSEQAGAA